MDLKIINSVTSHPASPVILAGVTQMEAYIGRRAGQGSHRQGKNENSLEESKSSGDDGFSLAELQRFHWLGLLLGKWKIFLLSGAVKQLHFLFGVIDVEWWVCGSLCRPSNANCS